VKAVARTRLLPALAAFVGLWAIPAGPALAAPKDLPVAVYVNVDEMAALSPFRDPETHAFPGPGEPGREAFAARWSEVIGRAFRELRRRVPPEFDLIAARDPDTPYALKIDVWIADLATSCNAPTFYKYLWVRTFPGEEGIVTNWDGLGVRSATVVDIGMEPAERSSADLDAWVELWAQVPYLHLRLLQPGEVPEPGPEQGPSAPDEGPEA
jgi:hypothetical protein